MHIVEIPSFFPPYGGEFCLEQSRALKARGHKVGVVSNVQMSLKLYPFRFFTQSPFRRHVRLYDVDCYLSYQRGIPKVIRLNVERWLRIVQEMFAEYVKENGKPDIIHAHCVKWAGRAAMLISREWGIPYVITEHLPSMIYLREFGEHPQEAWQVPLLREALEQANQVITVSEELFSDLAPIFGTSYSHQALSNTIDTSHFTYRQRAPLGNRPFVFCCLAINVPRKGYDVLLDAFDRLKIPSRLLIAGRDTDSMAFTKMLNRHQRKEDVEVRGELDKNGVLGVLYESDALVLATRSESQGLVILEAVSTGIPAITTEAVPQNARIEGATEIVPVGDAVALAEAMNKVMSRSDFDGRMYSEKVKELVSPEVIGLQLEKILSETLARSGS